MLCKKCRNKFGPSYRYLVKMVEEYKTDDKGMRSMKNKILMELTTPSSEIYELQETVNLLKEKIEKLEAIK